MAVERGFKADVFRGSDRHRAVDIIVERAGNAALAVGLGEHTAKSVITETLTAYRVLGSDLATQFVIGALVQITIAVAGFNAAAKHVITVLDPLVGTVGFDD